MVNWRRAARISHTAIRTKIPEKAATRTVASLFSSQWLIVPSLWLRYHPSSTPGGGDMPDSVSFPLLSARRFMMKKMTGVMTST